MYLPIFSGQGSPRSILSTYIDTLPDSRHASTLLTMCHEALLEELSSLSARELSQTGVDLNDFRSPDTLLSIWLSRCPHNPIMSSSTLVLVQLLRYLSFVERFGSENGTLTPFTDLLSSYSTSRVGVLGFSSGIIPACVVAASSSTSSYLIFALEAYRLALWIGIRCQLDRFRTSEADTALPWSVVFLGVSPDSAKEAISKVEDNITRNNNSEVEDLSGLYITAVIDNSCVTISGPPTTLAKVSSKASYLFGPSVITHQTTVDTLYHCPAQFERTRHQVFLDVARRNIRFPDLSDLRAPVRSTSNGTLLDRSLLLNQSLTQLVVDMLLVEPVRWDLVTAEVCKSLPEADVVLLNIGPGLGLARALERTCSRSSVHLLDVQDSPRSQPKQVPIAVVGMAVNMPGSPDASQLWATLESGINTLSEIPGRCFNVRDYEGPKNSSRQMKAHTGNFIDRPGEFDNRFFKISPREAKAMDPQQRVLLHAAYEALEDSGYVPGATRTSQPESFGCYIGVATHDYIQNLREHIDVYYSTGTLKAFLSGRISYAMGFSGPSIVVDTACSSSLVAIYQGARALMNGDCDAALVGGVNVITSPDMYLGLDRGHFLSPTGPCKPFDASADGYSRGEGCGMFVLKRLSDAISESDHIYGVIRGVEVNQSGLAQSITHPHAPTQMSLFKRLLSDARIPASRVNVIEAHGTGTQAGDVNELAGIRSILGSGRTPHNPLYVTSVKGNLGHLEAASGAASLAKLLLMLKHRTIPPQISFNKLNPLISPLDEENIVISRSSLPWMPSRAGFPRVALLNNFGAAGSNAALVLEEHVSAPSQTFSHPLLFAMSAKDEPALQKLRTKYVDWLQSEHGADISLADIAYSMTARRQMYSYRLSVVASERRQLVENLCKAVVVSASGRPAPKVVFVFSGQGGQYLGMGNVLYATSPFFKEVIDECHTILISMGFPGVVSLIKGEATTLTPSEELEMYQTAIFSLEYALARLWVFWGLEPCAVIGHSLGEYAALVFAGVLSLKGALTLVAHRVRLMLQKCQLDSTGMLTINLSSDVVEDLLGSSSAFRSLVISCYNSPTDCVVSGPLTALQQFKNFLGTSMDCRSKLLAVPYGYHSDAMSPLANDLTAIAAKVEYRAPEIPIASNVHGTVVLPGEHGIFSQAYFVRHCSEPVRFDDGVRGIADACRLSATDIWLEIGPHPTCVPMLKSNTSLSNNATLLTSLRRNHDPWLTLGFSLSSLFGFDTPIKWRKVFSHISSAKCISLPSYPFSSANYWIPYEDSLLVSKPQMTSFISEYTLLHRWKQYPCVENGYVAIFETPLSRLADLIIGHKVGDFPLCPASVFVEIVLAGVELLTRYKDTSAHESLTRITSAEFVKGLVYKDNVSRTVITEISLQDGYGCFSISSRVESSTELVLHVRGEYRLQSIPRSITKFTQKLPSVNGRIERLKDPRTRAEVFLSRTAYEVVFPRVVHYASEYHSMQSLLISPAEFEGFASIRLPSVCHGGAFVAHPVFLDTLLQLPGFIANMQGSVGDAFICSEITSIKVVTTLLDTNATYSVHCKGQLSDENILSFDVTAVKDGDSPQIIASMKGVTFRRMPLDTLRRGLSMAATSGYCMTPRPTVAPISIPVPARARSHSSPPNFVNVVGELHKRIYTVIAETCDVEQERVTASTELDALGIDSLMLIELSARLQFLFPKVDLQLRSLYDCKTVADIVRISSTLDFGNSSSVSSTTCNDSELSSPTTLVAEDVWDLSVDGNPDVKCVISSVLDIPYEIIGDEDDLESLGMDSLATMEILYTFKTQYGLQLPEIFLEGRRTVVAIQDYFRTQRFDQQRPDWLKLNGLQSPREEAAQARLIRTLRLGTNPALVQDCEANTPIFFIHDGSGLVNYYDRVENLNRPVYCIYNPNFARAQPWDSLWTMAAAYADYIISLTAGPVLLGGWSFGGPVAYEIALQLAKRGIKTKGIILIDSPNPIDHVPLPDALIKTVARYDRRTGPVEIGKLVQTQFAMNAQLLNTYDPYATGGTCPPLVFLRSESGYTIKDIPDIPSWLADRSDPSTAVAGWTDLTTFPIRVWDIPGHHFQAFDNANIQSVSSKLLAACQYLETL